MWPFARALGRGVALLGGASAICYGPDSIWAASSDVGPAIISVERGSAAADCPNTEALAESVNRITHRVSVVAGRPEDTPGIVVTLERDSSGYQARIEATTPIAGIREIKDPGASCVELANALAVTLALLVDPTSTGDDAATVAVGGVDDEAGTGGADDEAGAAGAGTSTPSPATGGAGNLAEPSGGAGHSRNTPPAKAVREPERVAPPSGLSSPERAGSSVAFDVAGGAGVALGMTFPVAPAIWLGLGAHRGSWRGELGVLWLPEQRRTVGAVPVEFELWAAKLRVCHDLWAPSGGWPGGVACLDGVGGAFDARARDVDDPTPTKQIWLGAGAGVGTIGRIYGPLAWRIDASALRPLLYERLRVRGQDDLVYEPSGIAGIVTASVQVSNW